MRILHMSSGRAFGDAERHVVCVCRELARRGHDIFVALRPTSEWQDAVSFLPQENILKVSVRNSFGMFSAARIARFVERESIEVVHAHAAKDYLAGSVIVRRASGNIRFVLTRHVARPLKPFHRFALRGVDAAVGLTPLAMASLKMTFPENKLHSITPGLDVDDAWHEGRLALRHEFRAFHEVDEKAPLVAAIGELTSSGGQRDLILAANEVVKAVPGCRFVVAGNDTTPDQRFRRELKRLAKVLGLEGMVIWLDQPAHIEEILAAADLFASPSHANEPPRPVLEAMAAGLPVVAAAGGTLVPDAAIVSPREPVQLADRITALLADSGLSARLAGEGKAAVRERFNVTRMADDIEAIYRKVLGA